MKKIVKTIKVHLPASADGLYAEIEIRRCGQVVPPYEGNDVVVRARILLPADGDYRLLDELQFGDKCLVADEPLSYDWGWIDHDEYENSRYNYNDFRATKWREAEAQAEAWAIGEVQKLVSALRERRRALLAADEE